MDLVPRPVKSTHLTLSLPTLEKPCAFIRSSCSLRLLGQINVTNSEKMFKGTLYVLIVNALYYYVYHRKVSKPSNR